jgi:AraC family transcriptional regulator
MSSTPVHRYGGRDVARIERRWDGVGVDLVRWRTTAGVTGLTERAEHQVFVTLAGSTGRTVAVTDDGRYDGADFPGATTFVPSRHRRRSSYQAGAIEYVAIRLDPRWVARASGHDGDALEFRGFTNRPDPLAHALAVALRDELRDGAGGLGGRLFAESLATTLALHLVRAHSGAAAHAVVPRPVPPLAGPALGRVLAHIEEHLHAELRTATLAAVAGEPPHRFHRAFRNATGRPPHRYVTERRLERAARLLRAADGPPIAAVAYAVGLSSQSHLTTAFRRRYGTTPWAYREAARR